MTVNVCFESHHADACSIIVQLQRLGGLAMKFWKIAALVALATIPLILLSQKKKVQEPVYADSDNIFENELSAD
jgi:hypothetical protein